MGRWVPQPVGAGAEGDMQTPDSLWDQYQERETKGPGAMPTMPPHQVPPQQPPQAKPGMGWQPPQGQQMGMGGEGGMGAGGVYVKFPDGSSHWDETRPDPNPNGGSVIDSSTGSAIPGANRNSFSSGPGGTGVAGSQARAAHVGELMANPSFISRGGGSIFSEANKPGWQPGSPLDKTAANAWSPVTQPGVRTPDQLGTNTDLPYKADIMGTGGEGGMGAGTLYNVPISGPNNSGAGTIQVNANSPEAAVQNASQGGNTATGGATAVGAQTTSSGGGGGGGGGGGSTQNIGITPAQQAQLAIDAAKVANDAKAEDNRHAEALAKIDQDWKIHQDDNQRKIDEDAENTRHNQANEAQAAENTRVQERMNALDNATKVQVEAMAEAAAKELEGMKEANAVLMEHMQEGNKILLQQGDEAFKDWTARQADLMNILGSALANPWLQQLSGMAPPGQEAGVMGGGNIQGLLSKILAPYDFTKAYGDQSQVAAPSGTDALNANAQGGAAGAPGQETQTPSYADWQAWSPFQKAAYRTNVEALGPGAWQTNQQALQTNFANQGGSPDVTALAGMSASPLESIGQTMTASAFGQTPDQWQKSQSRQWSQAQAPQVKQQMTTGTTPESTSQQATPEKQVGL